MSFSKDFKIDFLVIGVQKSGTSALDYYLRNHPEVVMANKKELHFFDADENFKSNKVDYSVLHKQFTYSKGNKIYGEITPSYIYWKHSVQRIKDYNPNAKIIAILRNPIERAFSHWNMSIKKKNETNDFITCIKQQIQEIKEEQYIQNRPNSYVDRGLYMKQVTEIFDHFPKQQVKFIKYEDFLSEQEKSLIDIFTFLEVNTSYNFQFEKKNIYKYSEGISKEEKELLLDFYKEDIKEIECLLSWNCNDWLN